MRDTLSCSCLAGLAYVGLYAATGFNWLESLLVATRLENRHGFALLHGPGTYLFTRVECVAELALFAGPTLVVLWLRSLVSDCAAERELRLLSILGIATLCAMLVTGAFNTGETARTCLFFYPFVVMPVAASMQRVGRPGRLPTVLLTQALFMQVVGDYFW